MKSSSMQEKMQDRIIQIIGFGVNSHTKSRIFLILDGKLMEWEEGLKYLREEISLLEKEIDELICCLPVDSKDQTKQGRASGLPHDQWIESEVEKLKAEFSKEVENVSPDQNLDFQSNFFAQ